jgi:hypothetical protein
MKTLIFIVALTFLIGCGGGSGSTQQDNNNIFDSDIQPITNGSWYKPDINTSWQWQLNGDINRSYNVKIYDIDLFDSNITLIQSLQNDGKKLFVILVQVAMKIGEAIKTVFQLAL